MDGNGESCFEPEILFLRYFHALSGDDKFVLFGRFLSENLLQICCGKKINSSPLVAGLPLPTASQVNSLHESVCLRLH